MRAYSVSEMIFLSKVSTTQNNGLLPTRIQTTIDLRKVSNHTLVHGAFLLSSIF